MYPWHVSKRRKLSRCAWVSAGACIFVQTHGLGVCLCAVRFVLFLKARIAVSVESEKIGEGSMGLIFKALRCHMCYNDSVTQ